MGFYHFRNKPKMGHTKTKSLLKILIIAKSNLFLLKRDINLNTMGAYNFRNENVSNSKYQKSDITIEFGNIELVENEYSLFRKTSF